MTNNFKHALVQLMIPIVHGISTIIFLTGEYKQTDGKHYLHTHGAQNAEKQRVTYEQTDGGHCS